ncbi:MAG: efflux RND transporter periplasmic adaptor subunit [Coriobacteriales bacterium]|nr:efflux RND transporter periplasmic adaptor subunit [Coriobacteriales bacterium]
MSNDQPSRETPQDQIPPIPAPDGVGDQTVASPALGYGMERIDFLDSRETPVNSAGGNPAGNAMRDLPSPEDAPTTFDAPEMLSRHEVAAVNVERDYYSSHNPSPYLSTRQAAEDVRDTRRKRSTRTRVIVAVLVVAALGAAGWFFWQFTKGGETKQAMQYDTREIVKGEFLNSIEATALVQPINECTVTPNGPGTIAEVFVEDGTAVEEGTPLFRLDNPTITDAVNKAQEALGTFQADADAKAQAFAKAQEEVAKAQEALDKATEEAKESKKKDDKSEDKDKDKAEGGGDSNEEGEEEEDDSSTSDEPTEAEKKAKEALEAAQAAAESARVESETATTNLYNMQETYNRALEQQATLTVVSPISGKVGGLGSSAEVGSSVSSSTSLCTVSDTSRFKVCVEIPKESADQVNIGKEARIAFPAIKDLNVTSTVASIEEVGESLLANIIIEEPDERITAGVAAEACVVLQSIPDSLMVPLEAIKTDENGGTHLDVLLDSTRNIVTEVPITIVATNGTDAAISAENIQKGNTVVVTPGESSQ